MKLAATPAAQEIRRRAEARLKAESPPDTGARSSLDTQRLLHELQVHQVELEMQNEELIEARAHIEAAAARYTELYDFAPIGYFTMDAHGTITQANLAGALLLGHDRSHLLGKRLITFITETDLSACHAFIRLVFSQPARHTCDLVLHSRGAASPSVHLDALVSADGRECRLVMMDMTAQKHAEAEREIIKAQFHQAQKMESVGRLAGGIAHDFNNMLQVIIGNIGSARMELTPANPAREHLDQIENCALRAAELTRQLLAFARKQTTTPKVLDLNFTVENMLKLLRRLIGENIELVWQPAPVLSVVKIDPSQVDQLLINLCVNARDATAGVGKITIRTGHAEFNAAQCACHPDCRSGHYVTLVISDTGCGMKPEVIEHLFEPFYTTKEVGQGTGLGLAIVYGVVSQNRGFITIKSQPGRGSTFTIHLPVSLEGMPVPRVEKPQPIKANNHGTILLVDDEPAIVTIMSRLLENLGYTLLATTSAAEALRLAKTHIGQIDLLISDVIMPQMNGRDLCTQLLIARPGLKCILMSGYSGDVISSSARLPEDFHYIQKPFNLSEIAEKVRAVLAS